MTQELDGLADLMNLKADRTRQEEEALVRAALGVGLKDYESQTNLNDQRDNNGSCRAVH